MRRNAWLPEIIDLLRTQDRPRFHALQAGHAAAPDRTAHGDGGDRRPTTWIAISMLLRSDTNELDLLAKDLLINVTSFFRDPKVFDLLATEDHSRSGARPAARSAAPHLDCRVQHGRGNLFACHALPRSRSRRRSATSSCRCSPPMSTRMRRQRAGGTLSGDDRGGRVTGATCPLLHQGRAQLPGVAGAARDRGVHRAGRAGRSAVLASRSGFVPEPADLFAPRGAGEGRLAVPFRAARGRHSSARQLGDGRQRRRPLRGDLQVGAALSAHRSQPAGRIRLF